MVYLISCDLNKIGKDYSDVYEAIMTASTGAWCHFFDSTWLIKSKYKSAHSVFSCIQPHLDSGDRCIVVELENNKQGWLDKEQWDYINKQIFS